MTAEHSRDGLSLDDQLCFALYAATNAIVRAYRPLLRELGLTYPQYLAMMALWQHGPLTVGELAAHLKLPGHALTPVLQRLERAELITRARDARDGRVVRVAPTPAGTRLEVAAAQAQQQVVCSTGLSPGALSMLRAELHALTTGLDTTTDSSNEGTAS